jgi:hypothetical protein
MIAVQPSAIGYLAKTASARLSAMWGHPIAPVASNPAEPRNAERLVNLLIFISLPVETWPHVPALFFL